MSARDNIDDAQVVLEQLRVQNALLREERAAALAREAALVAALGEALAAFRGLAGVDRHPPQNARQVAAVNELRRLVALCEQALAAQQRGASV